MHRMVIAIDGPAGAGKGTVARIVAGRLGVFCLDTGAMYRAATLGLLRAKVDLDDGAAIVGVVEGLDIAFDAAGRVCLDGEDVAGRIRDPETTASIWRVADNPACRRRLVELQRALIAGRDAVVEGRDATTVICPDAPLKVYLDASLEERARRRQAEWAASGRGGTAFAEVLTAVRERDARDTGRQVGGLRRCDDAVYLNTDGRGVEEVVATVIAHAVRHRPLLLDGLVSGQLVIGRSRQPGYVRVAQGCVADPPAAWQLGLTNPARDRLPESTLELARNQGGRQAGVLCQGRAVIVLAGRGEGPGTILALPMLPQTWYVIEPGVWHAVVQAPGTIVAWAEASGLREERRRLDDEPLAAMRAYLAVYLPERFAVATEC